MPIRPENRLRYPPDWADISLRIRTVRAGGRCECRGECGRGTHTSRCPNRNGQPAYGTGSLVVLTTAHLDHTPENCSDGNLRAMCNGCHLHYDREHHRQTAAATRRAALAEAGQLMFPPPAELARWALIVDEVRLYAIGSPATNWWFEQAVRLDASGAARVLEICIAGAVVEYGPWNRDDAQFMHDHIVEQGINPKVLTLREWMPDLPECTQAGACKRCGRSHRALPSRDLPARVAKWQTRPP